MINKIHVIIQSVIIRFLHLINKYTLEPVYLIYHTLLTDKCYLWHITTHSPESKGHCDNKGVTIHHVNVRCQIRLRTNVVTDVVAFVETEGQK